MPARSLPLLSPEPRSHLPVADLYPGASFHVPALAAPGSPGWWTVDGLHELGQVRGRRRVQVVLQECAYDGRAYRVELDAADHVVWSATLAPRALAVVKVGHHVWCNRCGLPWGWLPVTASNAPCFICDDLAPVGI